MTKLSKQLLRENDSYIVALKKAITEWENPRGTMKEKKEIFFEMFPHSEADDIITELLQNKLHYDGEDYSCYLKDIDLQYCDEAILIQHAQDIIFWANEIKNLL